MKTRLLLLFLMVIVIAQMNAQGIFTLTDSTFTTGSVYTGCPVNFDLNARATIRPESYPCLDSFAQFMLDHPEMLIEIGSHTDQRGIDSINLKFSQSRALRVKEYLESKGVPYWRMAAVGYGETRPEVKESEILKLKTKEEREPEYQKNRRTVFSILRAGERIFSFTDSAFFVGQMMYPYILFDFDKPTLRPETRPILDSLARFLIAHPGITIEINNHRDVRGSEMYGQNLTQRRSESVRQYLIEEGVPATQIKAKGYGETMPIIQEDVIKNVPSKQGQEELHALNRRTEIKIINVK